MATAVRPLDLSELRTAAETTHALRPYVARLELLRERINERCADAVLWAVAYSGFTEVVGTGKSRSAAWMNLLFVTNLQSVYESYETLADEVLGPLFEETEWFADYEAWTLDEFRRIAARGTNELLLTVLKQGVTLYGCPPYPSAD